MTLIEENCIHLKKKETGVVRSDFLCIQLQIKKHFDSNFLHFSCYFFLEVQKQTG